MREGIRAWNRAKEPRRHIGPALLQAVLLGPPGGTFFPNALKRRVFPRINPLAWVPPPQAGRPTSATSILPRPRDTGPFRHSQGASGAR